MIEARRPPPASWWLLALLPVGLLLVGCERPFVEERPPEIEVVAPDLSEVFLQDRITLVLRASSFRSVERVLVNGKPLTFNPETDTWSTELTLDKGLNALVAEAEDVNGVVGHDTLFAVHMTFRLTDEAPSPGIPLAGHTATRLADGSLLLAGGTDRPGGDALDTAYLLPPGGDRFELLPATMHAPRVGHTATLLPDGRVLLLGGSRNEEVTDVANLVEDAEVYDPTTGTFHPVPVEGQPLRRAFHTAVLRIEGGIPIVDLYGGRGDIRYRPSPRLGIRNDLRGFAFRNDTLVALSPAPGPFIGPLTGHTQTPLDDPDEARARRFLVVGSFFDGSFVETTSLIFDYRPGIGLLFESAPPPHVPRTRHAAVHLRSGFVLLLGGRQHPADATVGTAELYVEPAGQFFRLPAVDVPALRRHTFAATFSPPARILLTGGFAPNGAPTTTASLFEFDL